MTDQTEDPRIEVVAKWWFERQFSDWEGSLQGPLGPEARSRWLKSAADLLAAADVVDPARVTLAKIRELAEQVGRQTLYSKVEQGAYERNRAAEQLMDALAALVGAS